MTNLSRAPVRFALALALAAPSCSSVTTTADSGSPLDGNALDALAPSDAAVDALTPDAAVSCGLPLAPGPAPRALRFAGTPRYEDFSHRAVTNVRLPAEVWLFLPRGLVAGAPVLLTADGLEYSSGPRVARAVLAADLSSPTLTLGDGEHQSFALALAPGGGSLQGTTSQDTSWGNDVVEVATAPAATLCPTSTVPPLGLLPSPLGVAPTTALAFTVETPLQASALHVSVLANGVVVPSVTVAVGDPVLAFAVRPVGTWPVGAALTLDTAGTLDVLGNAVAPVALAATLAASTPVADLTFATLPGPGSVASSGAMLSIAGGTLLLSPPYHGGPFSALLALGVPPSGAASVTVRAGHRYAPEQVRVAVVDGTGHASEVMLPGYGGGADEFTVPVPGAGPLWLAVSSSQPADDPQFGGGPIPGPVSLDEVRFQ